MSDVDELDRLLSLTSRTFALSIPRLPEPLRRQVGIGYLVFRIADTVEDEGVARPDERAQALHQLRQHLLGRDDFAVQSVLGAWRAEHRPDDAGYDELLKRCGWVGDELDALAPDAADTIRRYVARTIDGMIQRLTSPADITDIPGVQTYCYHVAGIVGEMLTELFIHHHPPLAPHRSRLMELSTCFGEALQLVNILRDRGIDLDAGRRYVPDDAAYTELLDIAEQNCAEAYGYIDLLTREATPAGVIEFNAFNLRLAEATLGLVRSQGPGVKVPREVVMDTLQRIESTGGAPAK